MKNFFLFLLLSLQTLFSQNNKLSNQEYSDLEEKSRALISSNVDSSFILASKIEKSENILHKSFATGIKSYLYQLKGDTISSNLFFKKSFSFIVKSPESNESKRIKSLLYNYGGLIMSNRNKLSKSFDYYTKGKKISQELKDINQIIKFNNNLSILFRQSQNFNLALKYASESNYYTNKFSYKLDENQIKLNKANSYFNIGIIYQDFYHDNNQKKSLIDSAIINFKKSLTYSKELFDLKVKTKLNLASMYFQKNNHKLAESIYLDALIVCKENKFTSLESIINYNLGNLYFITKKYDKALPYLVKVDSLYHVDQSNEKEYFDATLNLAKIFDTMGDSKKAVQYSNEYLRLFNSNNLNLQKEASTINSKIAFYQTKNEIEKIKKANEAKNRNNLIFLFFSITLVGLLIYFLIKNIIQKRRANDKLIQLIEENKNIAFNSIIVTEIPVEIHSLNLDEQKENEIVKKLIELERKEYFLNQEFTLQNVAKKIKTNTTYLSYVVNKKFGKSFGEYANELKIGYAINQLINNPIYRKYSTQAIAESVGFKNAISFAKSFNKRTGFTPAQFIKKISNN